MSEVYDRQKNLEKALGDLVEFMLTKVRWQAGRIEELERENAALRMKSDRRLTKDRRKLALGPALVRRSGIDRRQA